jgi:hypothetical protein
MFTPALVLCHCSSSVAHPQSALANYDAKCTGESAHLDSTECNAWVELFDKTGGPKWKIYTTSRTDP